VTTHELVVDPPGGATRDDVEPVKNERADRIVTGAVTVLPFVALGVVCWQLWADLLRWSDVAVFLIMYVICATGVTVGFHRHLTHRSFKAKKPVRFTLAAMGSIAIEGPVISWVADHRKHHAFSDQEGDPHSPHVGHEGGWRGALRGLFHAHVGWLFIHTQRGKKERYAPDLLQDPTIRFVDRTFVWWALGGLGMAAGLGYLIGGTWHAALTGLLWGGGVRMLVVHHVTYSINSLCHFFGRRAYKTGDESRNLAWLSLVTFGESWHNNHHAFPTSARHGLRRWQIDPSWMLIRVLEAAGLVWDVIRIDERKQARKALSAETG
jgi:stearoyl-CoA desaturase (delta-9 desaturase)